MTEEIDATTKELKDRVFRSRFFGSFIIAFAAINWRAVYVLLFPTGDMGFLDRLDWIDGNLYQVNWISAIKLLLGPLAYACVNVALLPRFINWLEEYRYRAAIDHRNARERIDERLRHKQLEIASVKGMLTNEKEQTHKLQARVKEMERAIGESDSHRRAMTESVREFVRLDKVLRLVLEDVHRDHNVNADAIDLALLHAAGLIDRDRSRVGQPITLTDEGMKMLTASPIPERTVQGNTSASVMSQVVNR